MDTTRSTQPRSVAVRVGNLERDACVIRLIDHHLQGRLTDEDLEQRQRLAMAAVDADDLRVLLADLPQQEAAPASGRGPLLRPGQPLPMPRGVKPLLYAAPVLIVAGVADVASSAWQYSAEGHYITAAVAGAIGYATHAVVARLRR